jgi:hydroxymethylglutaryl-CoA lyase
MTAERDVQIREVGPRDGLQREAPIEAARRLALIEELVAAGLREIEVAAFVSERAVPAMAGAADIVAGLPAGTGCTWWALVPNMVGAQRALSAGIDHLTVTVSASEEYSRRNVAMSVAESAEQATAIAGVAPYTDVVISCAFGSPYEGDIAVDAVASLASGFSAAGASVTLADTTGMASPRRLREVLAATGEAVGLHLHDTRGTALVNAYAALELGVVRFDASVGGLGGSPFAKDAGGNLATEDFVYLLDGLGRESGVDLERLIDADVSLREWLGRPLPGRVAETELNRRPAPGQIP